jgi:hypothetical protein
MTYDRKTRVRSLATLGAAALLPLLACGSNNPPPATASAPAASVGMGQPPPAGYSTAAPPGYPGAAPPGYPGAPPAGYAPAQPVAPAPAGAPPQGYATPYATAYPQQPLPAPGAPPSPAPAASQTPPPLAPTDPNSLQGILQGIQSAFPGVVVPGGAASGDLTDAGLKLLATRAAPGMQPEGDQLKQNLTEGQHAVMMVTLQSGKCYAILGFSAPGAVKDLDLNLLAPPFYMTLAGQDLTHNNTPSIGGSPNPMCPVVPFPLQYKLDVFAKSGSGQVAVQLYSKTK